MSVPTAEDLDRWADAAAADGALGTFALTAYLAGADDPEVARALLALAGRRLRAGRPLHPLLARWAGERLEAAARRADGSALRVLRRGQKPATQDRLARVARVYWRIEALRREGLTLVRATEQTARETRRSFERCEKIYKAAKAAAIRPLLIRID